MDAALERREEIYNYFQANQACQKYFFDPANESAYVAYYNSMYLLLDSTESLCWHRHKGFSRDPLQAYLELWGIFQAVIIQQDSIAEIHQVIVGAKLDFEPLAAWKKIRHLRDVCAGHPARRALPKAKPLTRSFMGRKFGGYDSFKYEQWEQGAGITHPQEKLGLLLDDHAAEAEATLSKILATMRSKWP
jgi:hypothetical protein